MPKYEIVSHLNGYTKIPVLHELYENILPIKPKALTDRDAFSAANILKMHKEVLGLFYRYILCQENSASITLFRSLYHGKQNLITESE